MRILTTCSRWLYVGLIALDTALNAIGTVILAVLKRWEWCCLFVCVFVTGYMVTHLEATWPVFVIGMAFVVPPFCALPYVILNFGVLFSIHCVTMLSEKEGGMLSIKTYGPIVGWAVYLAYLAMLMHRPDAGSIGDVVADWTSEIMSVRPLRLDYAGTIVIPVWAVRLVYVTVLSPILLAPVTLFLWTRRERMNPTFLKDSPKEEEAK